MAGSLGSIQVKAKMYGGRGGGRTEGIVVQEDSSTAMGSTERRMLDVSCLAIMGLGEAA
jgi:hypothetical protein